MPAVVLGQWTMHWGGSDTLGDCNNHPHKSAEDTAAAVYSIAVDAVGSAGTVAVDAAGSAGTVAVDAAGIAGTVAPDALGSTKEPGNLTSAVAGPPSTGMDRLRTLQLGLGDQRWIASPSWIASSSFF